MELKQYWSIVWKWMWLIVLATGIAGFSSYWATRGAAPIYVASTTLMVGQSIQSLNPNSSDIYTSQQLATTYLQIVKTDPVLQGAIDTLELRMSPEQLGSMVNANIIQGTQLIQISVVDVNPRRAQALANEVAHQLILQTPSAKANDTSGRQAFIQKQVDELQTKIQDAHTQIQDLQNSVQVTASAREIADKQQQISTLQGQMNQWQTTYATLLNLLSPQSPNQLSVVESARLPLYPVGPNNSTTIMIAAALGCVLALGGAFLIEYIDDTLKVPDEVSRILQLPVVGTIARITGDGGERLVALRHPRSSHAEAYRVLRTNVQVADVDKPIQTLLITSSSPVEGKSVTAANLAVVMAQAGMRVVLVDADLRRPVQHNLFHLSNDSGLTNGLLQSEPQLDGYACMTEVENLRVITTGHLPPNPAELLGSKRMQKLIETLKSHFDMVIFDTPPCLPVADTAILARHMDGVLLIVNAGRTRRDTAVKAKETLQRAGARVVGVVLNRVSQRENGYYYYYSQDGQRKSKRSGGRSPLARLFGRKSHHEAKAANGE